MMDPIKFKDEAYQATARMTIAGAQTGKEAPAQSVVSAAARMLMRVIRRLTSWVRLEPSDAQGSRMADPGNRAQIAAGCSCC